jgi:DNA sulfur modification protein DndC
MTLQSNLELFDLDDAEAVACELEQIKRLRDRGAIFVANHSGGKDSQKMFLDLLALVPREQIFIVHAVLPEVEWEGVLEHIEATTFGMKIHTCRSRRTLLEMIAERGMFPSPSMRQCTSDLKRGPIERTIRQSGHKLIVNCMGMRADESANRAKLQTFKFNSGNSKNGREWYDWLPIHHNTASEVFGAIALAGQKPHWAYGVGMSRLSCVFCIMASVADLTIAAQHNPRLYRQYVDLEHSTGQVMLMPKKIAGTVIKLRLEQVTGVVAKTYAELEMA